MNSNLELAPPEVLNFRQRKFVEAFCDPDKPSFMVAAEAYRAISPGVTSGTARTNGFKMIHDPPVRETVKGILERAGLSLNVRADKLAALANSPDLGRVVSKTSKTAEGKTTVETRHGPGWKDLIKAIDLCNKSDGVYDNAKAAARAGQEEYRTLSKRFFGEAQGGGALPDKQTAVN